MATASPPRKRTALPVAPAEVEIKVSLYDRLASLLTALLFLTGAGFALLLAIWLTTFVYTIPVSPPVEYVELGGGDPNQGIAQDLEEPGVEEMADVQEPQIAETIEALTAVMSDKAATLEAISGKSSLMGAGSGLGDARSAGPGGGGNANVVPTWERWQVRFATNDIAVYARQLDYFQIELGAIGGGTPEVFYARNLAQSAPTTRMVPNGKEETRLRFNYTDPIMKGLDRQLLTKAGVDASKKEPLQFYPGETAALLAQAEQAYAAKNNKRIEEIRRTVFGVRPGGGGYEFFVIEQLYRFAPAAQANVDGTNGRGVAAPSFRTAALD
ncbi:MAG TPA: hypothetical protein VGN57_06175 [Pirellulaceae bacterium]|jgi:hypothetical protein|nr:hypothetical protein [Pirellulaceae bacterium]